MNIEHITNILSVWTHWHTIDYRGFPSTIYGHTTSESIFKGSGCYHVYKL